MSTLLEDPREFSQEKKAELLSVLQERFEKNSSRHPEINWVNVNEKLEAHTHKLWSLYLMETTGGEPDVIGYEKGCFQFYDCAPESPKGRRSVCYDRDALESRKKNKPENNAIDMATSMGIQILTEAQYRSLQRLVEVDKKTSSWIQSPDDIREKGGALFCDYRFGHVFTYHNGADSYYSSRGFRGVLNV